MRRWRGSHGQLHGIQSTFGYIKTMGRLGEFDMDLTSLESLGKIAGLGGIAIGAVVLITRSVIDRTPSLPPKERGPLLRSVAMGAFGIGALGIVAWLLGNLSVGNVTANHGGVAVKGNLNGSTITGGTGK